MGIVFRIGGQFAGKAVSHDENWRDCFPYILKPGGWFVRGMVLKMIYWLPRSLIITYGGIQLYIRFTWFIDLVQIESNMICELGQENFKFN